MSHILMLSLSALVISGCQIRTSSTDAPSTPSTIGPFAKGAAVEPVAQNSTDLSRETDHLPSMRAYTLAWQSQQVNDQSAISQPIGEHQEPGVGRAEAQSKQIHSESTNGQMAAVLRLKASPSVALPIDAPPREAGLLPGQYCFHKTEAENWLSIRLEVFSPDYLQGESVGTITHPKSGKTLYQQTFAGKLVDDQALVDVTTYIAGVNKSRQEVWQMSVEQLDMGRVQVGQAPCLEMAADFQS
ncbi:MAG: hypothetical protein HC800_10315 [Phormidesmis sp. RL_2_1]|nr:hypothetical protein [Phormidesmis sp. RL_2_1]